MKTRSLLLTTLLVLLATALTAQARSVKDQRASKPSRVQAQGSVQGVSTNKQLIPEGDTWTIRIANTSGMNYRCEVRGKIKYKAEGQVGVKTTKGECVLQTTRLAAKTVNTKVKLRSRAELDTSCRVPGTGNIEGAEVTRVKCDPIGNEEGADDAVQSEEDFDPPADEDAAAREPSSKKAAPAAHAPAKK